MADKPDVKLKKLKNIHNPVKICNDFYIGEYKVRNEKYLPKYFGETDEEYSIRSKSTEFVNMFHPIAEGIVGLVTRKDAEIDGLESYDFSNMDLKHNNLNKVIFNAAISSLLSGISFVMAMTHSDGTIYLKIYEYDDLYSYIFEDQKLVQIVFREKIEVKDGEFGLKDSERFVVFKIGSGDVWYKKDSEAPVEKNEELSWTNSLDQIPMVSIVTGKVLSDFEVIPKLYDIATMNMVHLNREGNIANLVNICSNPIPVIHGDINEKELKVGVSSAIRFDDKTREDFKYVEVRGDSIKIIQEKAKTSEQNIDKLTFDLLQKSDSKTIVDAEQTRSKNTSFLKNFSDELESKFKIILQFAIELSPKTYGDFELSMKKDFDKEIINIEIAKSALDSGDMSRETFYTVLRTGQLPKDFKIDDENARIDKEITAGPTNDDD